MSIPIKRFRIFREASIFPNAKWVVLDQRWDVEYLFDTGNDAIKFVHRRLTDLAALCRTVSRISGFSRQELDDLGGF